MKKISIFLNTVFGIGVLITLIAGGISVIGYIVAMFIGGDTAASICSFIYKDYFPWVIKATSVFVGCGLFGMYFGKKKALAINDNDAGEDTKQ